MRATRLVQEMSDVYRSVSVHISPAFDLRMYAKERGFMVAFGHDDPSYSELGAGAFGTVYGVGPSRVCKVFHQKTAVQQIKRELEMCRYLHPNVIQCFGVFIYESTGLMMERGGMDMFDVLEADGPFDDEKLDAYACDLISATSFLHAQNPPIYHLDLKLENLLHCQVQGYGDVLKVADFGLAHCDNWKDNNNQRFGSQLTPQLCGSRSYMPHGALALSDAFLPHRDAWAIGCILFAMAYGSFLYDNASTPHYQRLWSKIERNAPKTFAALFNHQPRFIEDVLARLIRPTPDTVHSLQPMFLSSLYQ